MNETTESYQNERADIEQRNRFYSRAFLLAISLTLPLTIVGLWLLNVLTLWPHDADIRGLIAVSVGILGLLIFFIFLYKFQMLTSLTRHGRWLAMTLHALVVLLLFIILIWLGFDSPWKDRAYWGNFTLYEAVKPWIIAVLVIGTISLLGSVFDFLRKRMSGEDTAT
ncbi:MAG: hypothetical protein JXA28_08060 [Bacteroidetes bacterium]|nr:hypothetical protein [Bacteroidota bacterium]